VRCPSSAGWHSTCLRTFSVGYSRIDYEKTFLFPVLQAKGSAGRIRPDRPILWTLSAECFFSQSSRPGRSTSNRCATTPHRIVGEFSHERFLRSNSPLFSINENAKPVTDIIDQSKSDHPGARIFGPRLCFPYKQIRLYHRRFLCGKCSFFDRRLL
jgi:hypothetical protein